MIRRKKTVDIIDLKKKEKNEVSLGNLFRGSIEWRLSFSPIYLALRRINKKFEYSSIVNELFRVRNNSLKQKKKEKRKRLINWHRASIRRQTYSYSWNKGLITRGIHQRAGDVFFSMVTLIDDKSVTNNQISRVNLKRNIVISHEV